MATLKSCLLFVSIAVAVVTVCSTSAKAQSLGDILGVIRIAGKLFCTPNGNMDVNGTATPVFPNAPVQLLCGAAGNLISSATSNLEGEFTISLGPLQTLLSSVLNACNLEVNTPLSTCNSTLPSSGTLRSRLKVVGIVQGLLSIFNLSPTGFTYLPRLP